MCCHQGSGHDAVGIGNRNSRNDKRDMDDHLPLDGVLAELLGVDESLEQMNRRDADQRHRQFDLHRRGIRSRGMPHARATVAPAPSGKSARCGANVRGSRACRSCQYPILSVPAS